MRRETTRRTQTALAAGLALLVLGWPSQALAHGVVLDHDQVDAVRVEAHYDNGAPMVDAQVSVYSPEDSTDPWMSGSVDDEGFFYFTPDGEGTWQVEVRQAGHGDTLRMEVADEAPEEVEEEPEEDARATETVAAEDVPAAEERPEASGGDASSGSGPLGSGPLQMAVTGALAVWALVMTALYFAARKRT